MLTGKERIDKAREEMAFHGSNYVPLAALVKAPGTELWTLRLRDALKTQAYTQQAACMCAVLPGGASLRGLYVKGRDTGERPWERVS